MAIEIRESDEEVRRTVARIDDPAAAAALNAERSLVAALGGGCQTPVGALASPVDADGLDLMGLVISLDGRRVVRGRARGARSEAVDIGRQVAAQLIAGGAEGILADVGARGEVEGRRL